MKPESKDISEIKAILHEYIKRNKFQDLFDSLDFLIVPSSPLFNAYVNAYSKYDRLKNSEIKGVIKFEDRELSYSKVINTLLEIVNQLSESDKWSSENKKTPLIVDEWNSEERKITIIEHIRKPKKLPQLLITAIWGAKSKKLDAYKYKVEECPMEQLQRKIINSKSNRLILMDIDDFTLINKKYGFNNGSKILEKILETLKGLFLKYGVLVYTGRDEFLIFFNGLSEPDNYVDNLFEALNQIDWTDISQELYVKYTLCHSIRETKGVQRKVYTGKVYRYRKDHVVSYSISESFQDWVIRTTWGLKSGKLNGKNRIQSAPKRISEGTKTTVHTVDEIYDHFS